MFAYDADTGELWSGVNGTWHNSGNPAAGSGEVATLSTSYKWFPFIGGKSNADQQIIWGASNMSHTVPSGFTADLSTYRQPDPTIADPSAYFQPTTYTGDGSSSHEINQDGNSTFEPSMVWIKSRSATTNHVIQDQVRGNFVFYPDLTNVEGATGGGWVKSFDSDGFTTDVNGPINDSGKTFVAWQWKANGAGSSNSDGSVSSTVSASTTSGFSIVKWEHTTSANYTVGHGLGVTPKMILVKTRDQGTNWGVYHSDITVGNRLILNTNSASTTGYWGANTWNSTVFSIGSARDADGSDAVAYCFAEVEGYSKIGRYEGNGSTDGPFIFTGFKPAWVMLKRYDSAGEWEVSDRVRDPDNPVRLILQPNSNAVEWNATTRDIDWLSNGFKHRSSHADFNASGGDYIYLAFAESPFKTATAR